MIERLMLFGLSRQEASVYLCLLKNQELTGYEVAKLTGISRSNVYSGLVALVENGAAYVAEGNPTKYVAVDLEEFCDNYIRHLQEEQKELLRNKPVKTSTMEGYLTIEGERHICEKIHHMLVNTKKRVYFSADQIFMDRWAEELWQLVKTERKVVLISERLPNFLKGADSLSETVIFYERMAEQKEENQIRLIIDSECVLTGEVSGTQKDTCLYSRQKNLVTVIKDAMRNEIELIQIKEKHK